MIASALRIGPKVIKTFGFDIVVYRECLCFSMEFCDMGYYSVGGIEHELKAKLHLLHSLNIVHMDIKPENITFSPYFEEYVFIDFGLSKSIKEPIGAKTLTCFTGSFEFCSQ
jgi:serine/threonine protein kinase